VQQPITTTIRSANHMRRANADVLQLRDLQVAPIDAPELPMTIRFEGLSDAEQRAALAAFPGGKRFVLAD
jgi:hypothetical protein